MPVVVGIVMGLPLPPNGAAAAEPSASDLQQLAAELLAAHNDVRAAAPDAPSPLPPLIWSDELASAAAEHAAACRATHTTPDRLDGTGENLFWTSKVGGTSAEEAVGWWAAERDAYTYPRPIPGCAKGKVCGHYTQVVWRATRSVGCAVRACGAGGPFGERAWELWVCRYAPAGNHVGRVPY